MTKIAVEDEITQASAMSPSGEKPDALNRDPELVHKNWAAQLFGSLSDQAITGLAVTYSFSKDIVLGRRQLSLIPYAVYLLRIGGLTLAIFGWFAPAVATGLVGVMGWLVDLVVNLVIAFGMFVAAEITLTVREIADRLGINSVAEENRSQGREPLSQ